LDIRYVTSQKSSLENDYLEVHLSTLFSAVRMQRRSGLELLPALYKLAKALSCRYRVPIDEADLIACVSSIHAVALSLLFSRIGRHVSNESVLLDSFVTYASAIINAEDFRRKILLS
jgi:hypothetical protein